MSPKDEVKTEDGSQHSTDQGDKPTDDNKDSNTKRRTKTGCLTCRKRRIKCGEERPICKNCIKSKRECTGYSQPVVPAQPGQSGLETTSAGSYAWHYGGVGATPPQAAHSSTSQAPPPHHVSFTWQNVPWSQNGAPLSQPSTVEFLQGLGPRAGQATNFSQHQRIYSGYHQGAAVAQTQISNNIDAKDYESLTNTSWTSPESLSVTRNILTTPLDVSNGQHRHPTFEQHQSLTARRLSVSSGERPLLHEVIYQGPEDLWDAELSGAPTQLSKVWDKYSPTGNNQEHHDDRIGWTQPTLAQSFAIAPRVHTFATSPLLDEKSQTIFRHFLSVTGPCMGLFERQDHPDGTGLPQLIWTHSLPAMAFSQPSLAHAILAIGAMHMSKLHLCNEDIAVKHFTLACRRIGRLLGEPRSRSEVSTLATILLLGYYEVMSGDHSRWNLHLTGATKLIMEHNYSGMMRGIRRLRSGSATVVTQKWQSESASTNIKMAGLLPRLLYDDERKIDQSLVSKFMGFEVDYDTQVQPNFQHEISSTEFSHKNVESWRIMMELYWWYCKQDVFQSLLSGDRLLLPYTQWKYCPPRGPIGNFNQANATMDYLWLLLARLTSFSHKDRDRKQQVVRAQGGHWIPAPGFLVPLQSVFPSDGAKPGSSLSDAGANETAKPSANEGRARKTRQSQTPFNSQPEFYGMMPPPSADVQIPPSMQEMNAQLRGQGNMKIDTDYESVASDASLQTQQALAEHSSISEAFDHFESLLGVDFQPIPSDDIQINTPFGPATRYRSPVIAAIWSLFFLGKIVLRRVHPHSPPAAMMSAAVNGAFTEDYALIIGRICGGLFAQHSYFLQAGHVNHSLSAAIMETTFPLLFAAVQFQHPIQRYWTISKLSEIQQVTGWQSSAAIASACETTWEKLGLAQKGPLYERTLDRKAADDRVNGKYIHTYGLSLGPTNLPSHETKSSESRFISHDRRLIDKHVGTRVHWALGLLSVEDDLARMAIGSGS